MDYRHAYIIFQEDLKLNYALNCQTIKDCLETSTGESLEKLNIMTGIDRVVAVEIVRRLYSKQEKTPSTLMGRNTVVDPPSNIPEDVMAKLEQNATEACERFKRRESLADIAKLYKKAEVVVFCQLCDGLTTEELDAMYLDARETALKRKDRTAYNQKHSPMLPQTVDIKPEMPDGERVTRKPSVPDMSQEVEERLYAIFSGVRWWKSKFDPSHQIEYIYFNNQILPESDLAVIADALNQYGWKESVNGKKHKGIKVYGYFYWKPVDGGTLQRKYIPPMEVVIADKREAAAVEEYKREHPRTKIYQSFRCENCLNRKGNFKYCLRCTRVFENKRVTYVACNDILLNRT